MSQHNWNLDSLYLSFGEQFQNDIKTVANIVSETNRWCDSHLHCREKAAEKLIYYITQEIQTRNQLSRLMDFCELTLSTDTSHKEALRYLEALQELEASTVWADTLFKKWLASIEHIDQIIQSHPLLAEHSFFIYEMLADGQHTLSPETEEIIALMQNTGSKNYLKMQELITSKLMVSVEYKGSAIRVPLAEARNLAENEDPELRKAAYIGELEAYTAIADASCAALNGIKGEVLTVSKLRQYDSVLSMTLEHSRMDKATLDCMLETIEKQLPIFHAYFKKKAALLGHAEGLPFYDLLAPVGAVNMKFTYEEAQGFIIENFSDFSPSLAEYARLAFSSHWIDVFPKQGKRGGAFCSNLHYVKESRILTNFNGSLGDVLTLAHELGHGYHGSCLYNESILNSDYPMPIAETASTFCETIVTNAALKNASKEEAFVILENDISSNAQVIVDILSRFYFEAELFKKRRKGSLTLNELDKLMMDSQLACYGEGVDKNYLHPRMWVCKPHYYDADFNYYNFPYAFGLLLAKGLYGQFLKEGKSFSDKYTRLLSATGKTNLKDLGAMAGFAIDTPAFWKSSFAVIEADIQKWLDLCDAL